MILQKSLCSCVALDRLASPMGESALLNAKQKAGFQAPLSTLLQDKLFDLLKKFMLTGGMPEAVSTYVQTEQLLDTQCVLDDLAEVDYVVQQGANLFPVEIKASGKGSMQSLRQFLKVKNKAFGYRFSLENYSEYEDVKSMLLYAVSNLKQ